jgi:hypothetical protein
MRLPKSFSDIFVGQFQECYFILKKSRSIESWVQVMSILSGIPYEELQKLPGKERNAHLRSLKFLDNPEVNTKLKPVIRIKGRLFKATYNATDLCGAQAVDIKTFLSPLPDHSQIDMAVLNADKLLASAYRPLTGLRFKYDPHNHKRNAELFKGVKLSEVYGTLFFYSLVWENWISALQAYIDDPLLKDHLERINQWSKSSVSSGDGRQPSTI